MFVSPYLFYRLVMLHTIKPRITLSNLASVIAIITALSSLVYYFLNFQSEIKNQILTIEQHIELGDVINAKKLLEKLELNQKNIQNKYPNKIHLIKRNIAYELRYSNPNTSYYLLKEALMIKPDAVIAKIYLSHLASRFGYIDEVINISNELLSLPKSAKTAHKQAFINLGAIYIKIGEASKSIKYYKQALNIKENSNGGAWKTKAEILHGLGIAYGVLNNIEKSDYYFHESLTYSLKEHDMLLYGMNRSALGAIALNRGKDVKAKKYYKESLSIAIESGNKEGESVALNNLGVIETKNGNYDKAINYYRRSLKITIKIRDKEGESSSLFNIGFLYNLKGDKKQAVAYLKGALKIANSIPLSTPYIEYLKNKIAEIGIK